MKFVRQTLLVLTFFLIGSSIQYSRPHKKEGLGTYIDDILDGAILPVRKRGIFNDNQVLHTVVDKITMEARKRKLNGEKVSFDEIFKKFSEKKPQHVSSVSPSEEAKSASPVTNLLDHHELPSFKLDLPAKHEYVKELTIKNNLETQNDKIKELEPDYLGVKGVDKLKDIKVQHQKTLDEILEERMKSDHHSKLPEEIKKFDHEVKEYQKQKDIQTKRDARRRR